MKLRSDLKVDLIQSAGTDMMIASAARVSTGMDVLKAVADEAHQREADRGLIKYLMKNRHGSPFEHGSMTFRIEAPIFVAREFMRHRIGWSYNEESGRYKVLKGEFYVPPTDRPLKQTGKAGAYEFEQTEPMVGATMRHSLNQSYYTAWDNYRRMIESGVAKEVARMCLPVGTYTSWYATCNPRSLMAFLSLRTKDPLATYPSYPMHEIEVVARGMEEHFAALYPVTAEAFEAAGRVSP